MLVSGAVLELCELLCHRSGLFWFMRAFLLVSGVVFDPCKFFLYGCSKTCGFFVYIGTRSKYFRKGKGDIL